MATALTTAMIMAEVQKRGSIAFSTLARLLWKRGVRSREAGDPAIEEYGAFRADLREMVRSLEEDTPVVLLDQQDEVMWLTDEYDSPDGSSTEEDENPQGLRPI